MANQERRVEKLEGAIFAGLTPAARVAEVVRAMADRNRDLVRRIMDTCPTETRRQSNAAYVEKMDHARAFARMAVITFHEREVSCRVMEHFMNWLSQDSALRVDSYELIFSLGATLAKDKEGKATDWDHKLETVADSEQVAVGRLARVLNAARASLREQVRGEWAGFDAICQSEFRLDGRTFLNGFFTPENVIEWVQSVLSEPLPERPSAGPDDRLMNLLDLVKGSISELLPEKPPASANKSWAELASEAGVIWADQAEEMPAIRAARAAAEEANWRKSFLSLPALLYSDWPDEEKARQDENQPASIA